MVGQERERYGDLNAIDVALFGATGDATSFTRIPDGAYTLTARKTSSTGT
ncbi:hypothetical protein [Streptomyces sp. NPDC006863]